MTPLNVDLTAALLPLTAEGGFRDYSDDHLAAARDALSDRTGRLEPVVDLTNLKRSAAVEIIRRGMGQ